MGNVFFGGGKVGMKAPSVSRLPKGYTELTYIQSSGTQCIDSGLTVNKTDSYEYIIDAQFTNDEYGGANGYMQFKSGIASGSRATIRITYDGSSHVENVYVNGTLKSTDDWTDRYSESNVKIGILKLGNPSNAWYTGNAQAGTMYSCQIYKAGTLVRNFVPCLSDADGVGLYDLVEGKFYGNAGTGSFIGGEEVA